MRKGSVHANHVAYTTRVGAIADDRIIVQLPLT